MCPELKVSGLFTLPCKTSKLPFSVQIQSLTPNASSLQREEHLFGLGLFFPNRILCCLSVLSLSLSLSLNS